MPGCTQNCTGGRITILAIASRSPRGDASGRSARPAYRRPMTEPLRRSAILIAHHDSAIGRHLEQTLASDGHEVTFVSDPGSALHHARTNVPDVLLVSVALAGREDLVFCRQWRLEAQTRLVPLVLVSDHADRESRYADSTRVRMTSWARPSIGPNCWRACGRWCVSSDPPTRWTLRQRSSRRLR